MSTDPLVSIGQGDSQRTITEQDTTRRFPVLAWLVALQVFALLAWIFDLARHR